MGRPKGTKNTGVHTNALGTRLPRRYKKHGKEVGNFYLRINNSDVNLRTKNGTVAIERAKLARKGQRLFTQDDGDTAATSVASTVVGTGATQPAPVVEPPASAASGLQADGTVAPGRPLPLTHTTPAALPPIGAPPEPEKPPTREQEKPGEYIPPPPGWAAAVGDAARAGGQAAAAADEEEEEDPEFLEEIIDQAAGLAVELQLLLQAWIIKKRLQMNAGVVPEAGPKAKARIIGKKRWAREIRKAMPEDLPLPGWVVAPLVVAAYGLPVQVFDGEPVKPDEVGSSSSDAPASAAPTSEATI